MKRKLLCLLTSLLMIGLFSPLYVSSEDIDLLNYTDNGEILGVASAFSVFVEEDFGANGCDCEGRIYAGHSANVGESKYYSAAYDDGASVVIGDGILSNFDLGNRIFVYGINGTNLLEGGQVYQADLFDKEEVFRELKRKSIELSFVENGDVKVNKNWSSQIDFIGEDPKLNVFNLNPDLITSCNYFFNYDVPEGSYVVVNTWGDVAQTQLYGMSYAGHIVTNNKDEVSKKILFNFYDATELTLAGTGTFYGTILAPFADVVDDITEGTHYTGGIVAKSYLGGVEWGNCTFDGGDGYDRNERVETTTIVLSSNTSINTTSIYTTEIRGVTTNGEASTTESTTITEKGKSDYTTSTTTTATTLSIASITTRDTTTIVKGSEVFDSSSTGTSTTGLGTTTGFSNSIEATQTTGRNHETTATTGADRGAVSTGANTIGSSTTTKGVNTNIERITSAEEVKENNGAALDSTDKPAKTEDRITWIYIWLAISVLCSIIAKK